MDSRKKYYDIKKRCYICVFSALLDAEYAGELQFEPTGNESKHVDECCQYQNKLTIVYHV
jgi:hypothetical protein